MTSLPKISEEQQQVINNLENGNNVVVDSVAGSGKTTSIRMVTESIKEKYNIYGFSPSTKAAQELESSIGIKTNSVSELLQNNFKFNERN